MSKVPVQGIRWQRCPHLIVWLDETKKSRCDALRIEFDHLNLLDTRVGHQKLYNTLASKYNVTYLTNGRYR